jgi:hypothetical protein
MKTAAGWILVAVDFAARGGARPPQRGTHACVGASVYPIPIFRVPCEGSPWLK